MKGQLTWTFYIPFSELYFKEDPDVKEERKPLLENTELYYKEEADVKDVMKTILKLEEIKCSGNFLIAKSSIIVFPG